MRTASLVVLILTSCMAFGQEETYENLKVLPKNITKQQLTTVMKRWTSDLGVRCSFCHVGEPGAPLSSYDFPSDDNKHKGITRQMVEMTKAINADYLSIVEEGAHVDCRTCHRGLASPRTLAEDLNRNLKRKGLDAAAERYDKLRAKYYGTDSFDFSEGSLNDFAATLAGSGKTDEALRFLKINLVHYPASAKAYYLMGDIAAAKGDKGGATQHLKKALELDPKLEPAQELLNSLSK